MAIGSEEPIGFHLQADHYHRVLSAAGLSAVQEVLPGHNHFTVIGELGRKDSSLFGHVQRMFETIGA